MEETTRASSLAAGLRHGHVAPHARACRESPEKLKPSGVATGQSKSGMEGGDAVEREREGGARGERWNRHWAGVGGPEGEANWEGMGLRGADV